MKRLIILLQLMMLGGILGNTYGATINVPANQPTIQAGIDAAVAGDTVKVAAGTYNEDISLKSGVIVKGAGADKTTIQGTGYGPVVMASGVDAYAKIDGFTITGGGGDSGSGIYCQESSPTISNNVITGNRPDGGSSLESNSGGGINCASLSFPLITKNVIYGNSARSTGGGIFCYQRSSPVISFNLIMGNMAGDGGAIFSYVASHMVTNNVITGNRASRFGGGIISVVSTLTITNNVISGNIAGEQGGGIHFFGPSVSTVSDNVIAENQADQGGGIFCREAASSFFEKLIIANNLIEKNTSNEGGGIYFYKTIQRFTNNIVRQNNAVDGGGGIYCYMSSPSITYNVILDNSTKYGAGGITCADNSSPEISYNEVTFNSTFSGAGGISCALDSAATITNNTITGNSTFSGTGGIGCLLSSPTIDSNLIRNNTAENGTGGITIFHESTGTIINNEIIDNTAMWGTGGIHCEDLHGILIEGNTIRGNATVLNGAGGIGCRWASPIIWDNDIVANFSAGIGGGIGCDRRSEPLVMNNMIMYNNAESGGGIGCFASDPRVINNVIIGNSAHDGGGVYGVFSSPVLHYVLILGNTATYGGGVYCSDAATRIINCIIWGNGDDLYGCNATYSCIEDGDAGEGNISLDPLFVDAANGNYQLSALSPCIDAGYNLFPPISRDMLGNPRYLDGDNDGKHISDMGPYEYVPGMTVEIDIKPGNAVNPVNPRSKGRVRVALLTTDDFDAWAVDFNSITFGPNGARPVHVSSEDVDGDGDLDVVFHFRQQDTGIGPDDTSAALRGTTGGWVPFVGSDRITIVPRPRKK